jgi:hypothetical protein
MTFRSFALFAGLSMLVAQPAWAEGTMSAGEFLRRAGPLMNRSPALLMFSSEARSLVEVAGVAAQDARQRLVADHAAGRRSFACPPENAKIMINNKELLAYLRALPPAKLGEGMNEAMAGLIGSKYPCRN